MLKISLSLDMNSSVYPVVSSILDKLAQFRGFKKVSSVFNIGTRLHISATVNVHLCGIFETFVWLYLNFLQVLSGLIIHERIRAFYIQGVFSSSAVRSDT